MYLKHFKGYCIRLDTTTLLMEDVDTISDEFRVDVVRSKSNPVLEKRIVFKVYKRRWFILFVLCLLNCSNSILWLTFAPVVDHSAQFLGVTLDQINWLSIIYMVVAIPLSFGTTWMLDTLGLRITLVLGSWLNTLGAVLRFVGILRSLPNAANFPVVMGGQTLCALAQPLVIVTPTKLAALWFPEHQRATANMIASMSNPLGILIASIFSPMIVGTTNNIPLLLFIYAVPAAIICLLATVGIRDSSPPPPTPPSASAESSNSEPGGNQAGASGTHCNLCLSASCSFVAPEEQGLHDYPDSPASARGSLFTCFSTLLEQIMCVRRTLQDCAEVSQMRNQGIAVAVACSLCGFFGFSIYPVAMELSVECSYPVGEATSASLIFISGQIQSVIYCGENKYLIHCRFCRFSYLQSI
ncbi:hypothetical protein J4Q44_G00315650 [Coregonus suidteri]|uniref:Major facilitator superfamily (MFS) profile domain-containing protein n=1 Tax=Coregonus suidteri TaxID=861788 RepID=A0AAN8L5M6_9TELE